MQTHPFGTVNIEGIFNDILNELRSLKPESEFQRKEILNLKHRDACQCLGSSLIDGILKSAEVIAAGILNLGNQIEDKLPNTEVSFSSLIVKNDKTSILNKINNINIILKRVCD